MSEFAPASSADGNVPGVVNSETFLETVEPYDPSREYLGPLVYAGNRLTIMGPMGQGKTSLMMEMAAAIAKGTDFLGFQGAGAGARVAFLNTEMGDEQMAQAIRDARAAHPNLDVLNRRFKFDTSNDDKRLMYEIATHYGVVMIDPWYQFVEMPMENYTLAGRTAELMTRLQTKCSGTAFVIGTHSHEPSGKQTLGLANIMGYKNYHWNADTILMMQRIGPDVSRLGWEKVRNAALDQYGVKLKSRWTVLWERGRGFTRMDDLKSSVDVVLEVLRPQWMSKAEIVELTELSHATVERALAVLCAQGKLETGGGVHGGKLKFWRLVDERQQVLDTTSSTSSTS